MGSPNTSEPRAPQPGRARYGCVLLATNSSRVLIPSLRCGPTLLLLVSPVRNDHPRFAQRVKQLTRQAFATELVVEALHEPVLPRTPGLDVKGLDPHPGQPLPKASRHE